MAKRGRPKVNWQELKARGAKPNVWQRRQREDEPPEQIVTVQPPKFKPNPEAVAAYVKSVNRECETFPARCVPTEILTRQYGAPFDWPEAGPGYKAHGAFFNWSPSLLAECRTFARNAVNDSNTGPCTRELSTRFLADLETTAHGCHLDVEAAKNVQRMIEVFADPEKPIPMLRKLAMLEFLCWKTKANEPRFANELLLDFNQDDMRMIDQAILAERAL